LRSPHNSGDRDSAPGFENDTDFDSDADWSDGCADRFDEQVEVKAPAIQTPAQHATSLEPLMRNMLAVSLCGVTQDRAILTKTSENSFQLSAISFRLR